MAEISAVKLPGDNTTYNIKDAVARNTADGKLSDAPNDGSIYGRRNGTWTAVPTGEDFELPVGTILIMSTNAAPDLTGTWTLIDKEFSCLNNSDAENFSRNTTNISAVQYPFITRAGHTVTLRLTFTTAVAFTDSALTIGTWNLTKIGVSTMNYHYFVAHSDGGEGILMLDMSGSGVVSSGDFLVKSGTSMAANSTCRFTLTFVSPMENMLDSACDKFYFKRTA